MKRHLHIDIETYCDLDLTKVGVYKYAKHPSFKILLFAYAWGNEAPVVVDLVAKGFCFTSVPFSVYVALTDENVLKIAHNANFEMVCLSNFLDEHLCPDQWFCTQVGAAYMGLPLGLDAIAKVLDLDSKKDAKGKALIKYFSMPCKPTKVNGGRTVNLPEHAPDKWSSFRKYNAQDVRVEQEIFKYLCSFEGMPPTEWAYWVQDQEINNKGVAIDTDFVEAAIFENNAFLEKTHTEIKDITGIDNPNSLAQLKGWIGEQTGRSVDFSLAKENLEDLINNSDLPENVLKVLRLRALCSKSSVSKYDAMMKYLCSDGRIRGLLQFYGANRTGRFAGRGVQVQNLKRTMGKGVETAKEAVRKGLTELLYDDVQGVISSLIRTAIIAPAGKKLVVSDFSAIEARVIAWLAGEQWVLDVFNSHGKLYEATASKMLNVPIESVTKGSDLRQKGKVAALALGYQGGSGALIAMGALREGLTEQELPAIVRAWRVANPAIVKLWAQCEQAAKHVILKKTSYTLIKQHTEITFFYERSYLFIRLPSGRLLSYYGAQIKAGKLVYYGMNQTRKTWEITSTYGGSLVENIVQAIARDCLVDAMYRMRDLNIIMHVHDEIVTEAEDKEAESTLVKMNAIMAVSPTWAKGLPLSGDGYVSSYYKKD